MQRVFGFFLRLFSAFVAAKLLLGHLGLDTPGYLLGLSLLLVANTYLFDLLEYRHPGVRRHWPAREKASRPADAKEPSSRLTS